MTVGQSSTLGDGPIVLVGLMAAGKTSVGQRLAADFTLRFVDLDTEIERRAGMSVPELFSRHGELAFRELEARVSEELMPGSDAVVAVGGGWMANPAARGAWPTARTVWLAVSPAEAARRIGSSAGSRPLLNDEDTRSVLARLLAQRLPAYGEATYTVDTEGRRIDEVATEVARLVRLSNDQ